MLKNYSIQPAHPTSEIIIVTITILLQILAIISKWQLLSTFLARFRRRRLYLGHQLKTRRAIATNHFTTAGGVTDVGSLKQNTQCESDPEMYSTVPTNRIRGFIPTIIKVRYPHVIWPHISVRYLCNGGARTSMCPGSRLFLGIQTYRTRNVDRCRIYSRSTWWRQSIGRRMLLQQFLNRKAVISEINCKYHCTPHN